ncbi:ribonuclease H-like domain-containing protein [Tanacetum coccineum]|uniref:Ribonuclease H-like domain-containing protein n=1 Tax=Tanacetum coccineum TaxID=301880 RepID=A0ABQ5E0U2_9ASTR
MMTTVNQRMSVEEIERVVAQRVVNAIEAIAIYETKTNMARKSISQTEQQECKVAEKINNKRKWEGNHNGQCTVKFGNCKKVDHITRDCRNPATARNQRTHTCYECGSPRHFKSECPIVKSQKRVDKKISTLAERQTENKRKFENTSRNSQNQQQQQIKRQNTGRAYLGTGNANAVNNQRVTVASQKAICYECGNQGHYVRNKSSYDLILPPVLNELVLPAQIIENGNSWVPIPVTAPDSGPSTALKMTVPSTTEEKICKKNDVKARTRFGGNDATKKTQKALLKQQYEKFNATSSESLDSIFNRLQKLVSRLAIIGVDTPVEDLNVKFLRSLPSEWDTHVVVWMNKPDFETMGLDDLYNNFKIVEQKVKRTVAGNNDDKNLAFLTTSSSSSTNQINTVNTGVSTGTTKVNTADLEQIHDDDLEEMDLKWNMALLSMRARKFYQRTRRKIVIDGSSTAGYDKSKGRNVFTVTILEILLENVDSKKHKEMKLEPRITIKAVGLKNCPEKAMCAIDGGGFDWSDMAEDEVQANMALMAFTDSEVTDKSKRGFGYTAVPSPHPLILNRPTPLDLSYSGLEEFQHPEINGYGPRNSGLKSTNVCDRESNNSKENTDDSLTQQPKTVNESSSVVSPLKVDKDWREKIFHPANHVRVEEPKKARENNDAPIIEDWVSDDEEEVESIPKEEKKANVPIATKKESVKPVSPSRRSVRYAEMYRSQRPRGNHRSWNGHKSSQLGCNFVFNNKACFICGNFDHIQYNCPNAYKHMVPRAVLMRTGLKTVKNAKPLSTARSVNTVRPVSTARFVNTVRPYNTAHPKPTVSCARPKTHFQNQAQRPFYKNTALTKRSNIQNINTAKQAVNTVRPNVNTVRARGFNASNSQLNEKGFVDSGCSRHMSGNIAHLSDFKEFDGGYVTFGGGANGGRITGKGTIKTDKLDFEDVYFVKELKFNLFSVSQMCDKKNYVLFTDSECLVLSPNFKLPDESQVLLKIPRQNNMYSFDMKNIVPKDGLTCLVAKATSEESMLWHRRLGHVNFKNINKLVKDNLVRDLPLKRSDNGTEFKNHVMDEFYREKGIKREYSVARTPQQNGVAERKNMTLIEAARTMLADSKLPTTFLGKSISYCLLCFMKPFGCHVTILNTLDKLGKFDGKSDEGFFVGYSLSSKAFRVYNIRSHKVQENLHVGFLENKPMVEGNGPKWLFDLDSLTQSMNYVPVVAGTFFNVSAGIQGGSESSISSQHDQNCIFMPIWKDASYFEDDSLKSVDDAQLQDQDGTHDDCSFQDDGIMGPIPTTKTYKNSLSAIYERKDSPGLTIHAFLPVSYLKEEQREFHKALSILAWVRSNAREGLCDDVIEKLMKDKFQMSSMGELTFFLGLQVQQKKKGIFISQDKYVHEILKKFNYTDVKSASTPTDLEKPLVKDADADDVDEHLIELRFGSMMYLTASRPDIMFAVCACARFQVSPKTSHLLAVKRIFRYLKGKPSLGLWYSKDSPLELVAYTDS